MYVCMYVCIYYMCAQTLTETSPHCAPLHQRHSSYAMSFHAMLCYAPNDEHTRNTIRIVWFDVHADSQSTPRIVWVDRSVNHISANHNNED